MGARRFGAATSLALIVTGSLVMGNVTTVASQELVPAFSADEVLAMAHVDAPPAGVGLRLVFDYPADAPLAVGDLQIYSMTVDLTPDGGVITRNAVTSANAGGDDGVDGCTDPAFAPTGVFWDEADLPLEWYFRRVSTPKYMSRWAATQALKTAHRAWPRQVTDCNNADPNTFHFSYQGGLNRKVGYDERNLIDFGSLDGALAVSYTWYRGTKIEEVDLRFNSVQHEWTNVKGGSSRYQLVNVATHEIGHHLGLDDLSDPHGGLTMFGVIGRGEMTKATLGRGDMKGAETVSP